MDLDIAVINVTCYGFNDWGSIPTRGVKLSSPLTPHIEYHIPLVRAPTSYSWGPVFRSEPSEWLSRQFVVFVSPFQINSWLLPATLFSCHLRDFRFW